MKFQKNILQYFDSVIQSLKKMEKSSELFSELKNISEELEVLEQYVKTTFDTLDNNYNSFVKQINLLSELVDFQRSVIGYKSTDKIIITLFEFLQRNLNFDHGFIAFKLKEDDQDYIFATNRQDQVDLYRSFVQTPEIDLLRSLVEERDMAYLITNARQFYDDKIQWDILEAHSIILFPVKVGGKFLGMGFVIRRKDQFSLNDLSFTNLNIGIISLIIYQHFYFAKLKSRLFKQFRLRKMLEEVKYAEYFEKGPLYIFTLDPRFVVLHANTAAISNLRVSEEMIIGENFLEIIPKSFRAGFAKILEETVEGQVQYYRSPILSKNGVDPILEFYVSRIELQNHFSLILVFSVEVTQMYYREQKLRRNEVLDEMDQFSRTLVTEFNNLLTVVVPNISLLRTQLKDSHPFQAQLATVEEATQRSANLIQKFLNFDLEEFESAETGNLNKLIKSFIAPLCDESGNEIDVKYKLDPGISNITFYPLRLKQLLKILWMNSVQALNGQGNPEIRFSTKVVHQNRDGLFTNKKNFLKAGEYVELCVYDNGCGIPEKSLPQVFKPFYSTKIKNEGVGLGLFIAYNIVKDMKGDIYIESKAEKFTAVYVYLPIKEVKTMEVFAAEEKIEARDVLDHPPTVLVVDDEYNIRSMMKEIMEMYGFKVYTAGNGRDGVEVYQRHIKEIDLVILDMVMPVMDGRTAFVELKKIDPNQKIFIISGYSQREDLDEILQKGAIGFMRKPFQVNEIVTKIKEILDIKD